MSGGHAVIVGGGVIGSACAYYLSQAGWKVTIVERGRYASGCSHANCGLVSPSHVLPLAMPGMIKKTLKIAFKKNSPLYIKPRFDPVLWRWLWKFARRCNEKDMIQAGSARAALLNSSRVLYEVLIRTEQLACEWQTRGCLFVYQQADKMEEFAPTDQLLREKFDMPARRLDGEQLVELEPALKPNLAGAWYYEIDAHLRPDRLLDSWRGILENRGIGIREQCELTRFVVEDARAKAVEAGGDTIDGDVFIVATGALTPMLNRHLGCKIPIQPGKGYSITMARPERCPAIPMIFPEVKVAVTPMDSGYRLGSTMEFSGYDTTLNRRRLDALKTGASIYLHQPYCDPVEEEWYGWRPMTYDGVAVIDRVPAANNIFVAAGHNMLGLSMAPATGKLVSELICGDQPHIDPSPYRLSRF